jgi:hypothetical protein
MGTEVFFILDGLLGGYGSGIWKLQVAAAADGREDDADAVAKLEGSI